jgi:glutathione S-transferase
VQLPVLLVDNQPIAQTGSILRYIDKLTAQTDKDDFTSAQADSAFEAAQEMPMAQIYVAVNLMEEAEAKETARAFKAALPQYLANWTKVLGSKQFFHGKFPLPASLDNSNVGCTQETWMLVRVQLVEYAHRNAQMYIILLKQYSRCAGLAPGYADFFIWALLDTAKGFVPDMFKDHTNLKTWSTRVKELPAVANYISTRPKVRDVSKWKV